MALLELIDGLPSASRYNEAVLNDPEYARALTKLPEPPDPWAPRIAEMDLHAVQLKRLIDVMNVQLAATINAAGGNAGTPDVFPGPRTLLLAAQETEDKEWAVAFAGLFGFGEDDL